MRCKCHNLSKLYKYTHIQFSGDNSSVASVVILMLTVCILFLVPYQPAAAQTVHIPDPGLRAVIEAALGKEAGADITQSDMESLESLQARCRYVTLSEKGWFRPLTEHWVCETTDDTFVSSIKNLTGLEFATNLIELEFSKNQISDVTPLKNLINLTHLSLGINQISDVTPLKNLINLTHLSLGINQISDVTPLKNLKNLIELDLLSNRISDVTPLKNLTKLTHLSLRDNQISDVTPLKNMTKLIYLSLRDNQISDVSPLKNFVKLTYLNLDHNYKIDVSPFKNLINLRYLSLDDNQISDATPLKNLTKLIHLDISDNPIPDLTPLKDMKKMIDLDLDSNGILDISPLKHLTNLAILDLAHNKISDISALKPLTKLRKLELDDNTISDLAPLKDMTNLFLLELDNNRISDVTSLKNLTKLTVLDLSYNHISDFSPITDLIDNLIEYDFSNQTEPPSSFADVNRDDTINLADLVAIASNFADPDLEALARINIYPDVNRDGFVNLIDLLIAASEIDTAAAAPTLNKNQIEKYNLTAKDLAAWIRLAKQLNLTEPNLQQGMNVLEQLLATLSTHQDRLPKNTALLPNYPNPFNPETWIPYQLAKISDVSISIHSADGKLVRSLELGQLPAGVYKHKSRAAYWDGRNALGESVASGVYFYTLTANEFTATAKMLIQK